MTQPHAIYAGRELRRSGPPRPSVSVIETACRREPAPAPRPLDAAFIAVLESGPIPGETIELSFRRKECELAELFAALSIEEAHALHRRLATPRDGDAVAAHFMRLVVARRERLLGFLADTRRRAARKEAKRG